MPGTSRSTLAALVLAAAVTVTAAGCSLAPDADGPAADTVVVGYQSKTIDTVTAGTLLRDKGFFEKRLAALGGHHRVDWQDFDTGAPITTGMLAGKIDIGSMGDYPLLINGSRAQQSPSTETRILSITGSSATGALNDVVVAPRSNARTLSDLRGKRVSASVGSAGHGTLVAALTRLGIDPTSGVSVVNQQPQVGASALDSGQVDALAQFVAWPGLLVFQNRARLLYDGGALGIPTLHGVVAGKRYADTHADIVTAFLQAQLDATDYLIRHPLEAAQDVARDTGLPAEVVYLYNGPGGTDFDTRLRPELVAALRRDTPYLESIGQFDRALDVDRFVDDAPLQRASAGRDPGGTARIRGHDPVCGQDVTDAAHAGEIWYAGATTTAPAAGPECLLKALAGSGPRKVRAAYIPDTLTGTRWFADRMVWLRDGGRLLPFATQDNANRYIGDHAGAQQLSFADAEKEANR
ncbi:ABC transporter substrate-binding protein [Tsukamurella sp. 8F]|uniref:ABC transporter substrate-binding protein n=1 Tax=unclassified Tsukamurella TaxID=2633480 RepID=UPI0023B9C96D|nr:MULTISPECIES: ABC transporter substrate-binding protein [unclassified Tsukamurella]MDF0528608.1 ABC transporter substrate-binding protein [Tsukamurella sp. 8J]MDF0585570.1 ABC transporter substrate-binding protein [Tsukamurella sp. 8F]